MVSKTHIYVLLNILKPSKKNPTDRFDYYIVPSKVVAKKLVYSKSKTGKAEWWLVWTKDILRYKGKWDVFGDQKEG